jgi:beta-lactam-binding protein with PASTA domain
MVLVSLQSNVPAGTVPDLRGMSAREAMRALVALGLTPRLSGDGFVVSQDPPPGSPVVQDGECLIVLDRRPVQLSAAAQP